MDFAKARDLFLAGVQDFEANRFAQAEGGFRASLALLPGRASTLTNLGATLVRLARPEEALGPLQEALAAEPGNLDAWCHRGAALGDLGRDEEALACYDKAIAIDSAHAAAWYHRGITLGVLHRYDDALAAFEQFLRMEPAHAKGWLLRCETLQGLERHEEALASCEKALGLDPALGEAWSQRGSILRDARRLKEAAACFEKAIAHGADAELNGYFLAALTGVAMPTAAPGRYVEFMFDGYADKFDEHLVKVLHYQAHKVLVEGLTGLDGRGAPFASALDLGCGTGLCGPLVKPRAARLDGVDLSQNMLDKARALGVYEQLAHADIATFLRETDQRYDLVLSADVFIYVGDLEPVFQGVRRVLQSGGIFCFSAECALGSDGFALRPSLRYAHSERYLRELAGRHGLEVLKLVQHPIREDQREPVQGLFAYLAAPMR
ncbi:MAG TPA: tetratricopeptide repeat protein [Burkholderiaceae bacterium]|nr:tetratricopeptide repeat protein [Burkholderiaceae bacterium]